LFIEWRYRAAKIVFQHNIISQYGRQTYGKDLINCGT